MLDNLIGTSLTSLLLSMEKTPVSSNDLKREFISCASLPDAVYRYRSRLDDFRISIAGEEV